MVTMTLRSPLALLGALPGAVLALTAALAALLRRDKPLHPVGHHGTGYLRVINPAPELGIEAISRGGTRSCQARWSRAMGLPQGWPDIEGLALRLHDAGVDGDDADVLFASTGSRPWNRYLLVLRGPRRFGRLTTLLPVRARSRAVTFRLSPSGDTRDGRGLGVELALGERAHDAQRDRQHADAGGGGDARGQGGDERRGGVHPDQHRGLAGEAVEDEQERQQGQRRDEDGER